MAVPHLQMRQGIRLQSVPSTHSRRAALSTNMLCQHSTRSPTAQHYHLPSRSAAEFVCMSAAASHTASSKHSSRSNHSPLGTRLHRPLPSRFPRTRILRLVALQAASVVAKSEVPTPSAPLLPTLTEVDTALTQVAGIAEASQSLLTLTQFESEEALAFMKESGADSTAFELSMLLSRATALFPQQSTRWAWQKYQLVRYILYCSTKTAQTKPVVGKKGAAAAAADAAGSVSICGKDAGESPTRKHALM